MPNVNAPHGLRPLMRTLAGGFPSIEEFYKDAAVGTAIFLNDVVNRKTDSYITAVGTPGTTPWMGVALNFGAASTLTRHQVIISADAVFEAQGDASGTLDAVDLGLNANLVLTAGDAATQISKHQIAESTKATTATLDLKLLRLLAVPGNAHGANARIEVMFNKHALAANVAGV